MIGWIITSVSVFAAVFCVVVSVLSWRSYRQWRRLNDLLLELCVHAFMMRHAAVWVPWQKALGFRIRIVVEEKKAP